MSKDYYSVLEINKSASDEEIQKQYRKLVFKYHPDKNPGNKEAEEKLKKINEAYDVLSNPQKRKNYDTTGNPEGSHGFGGDGGHYYSNMGGFNVEDIFDMFTGGGKKNHQEVNLNIEKQSTITFNESYTGKNINLSFEKKLKCETCNGSGSRSNRKSNCRMCAGRGVVNSSIGGFFSVNITCNKCNGEGKENIDPCNSCRGTGGVLKNVTIQVKIPAGIENGSKIRVVGEGHVGVNGERNGDLFLHVYVKSSDKFYREGRNLIIKLPVELRNMLLGGTITIPLPNGENHNLTIKECQNFNKNIIVKNLGFKDINRSLTGDLIIIPEIIIPKNLTEKQKEILKHFFEEQEKNSSWW
ncbi:hypothetical protein AB836_00045 [Rickettsiales bacterium (ex Bugula neritina AB1)]|nr:hypothetical protein AB836_00045 [Rickettsiales bacterium (ex Bugula neritina AB1)]